VGSLFTGGGGLDLAVHEVLDVEPAWFVESDPAASKVLAAHWPDVPNLGDITVIDWTVVERVPVLTAGFPCQDISSAGLRIGMRPDNRSGLWSHAAYAISQLRPELVIIENVRGLLSANAHCDMEPCSWCMGNSKGRPLRALGAVLGDLANIGYDAQWCGLPASAVGAAHRRFRVFVLAWSAADTEGLGPVRSGGPRRRWPGSSDHGEFVADTDGAGRGPGNGLRERDGSAVERNGAPAVADSAGIGWGEGRPEPAGLIRGSDVAFGGDGVAADPAGPGRGSLQPEHVSEDGGETVRGGETEPRRCGGLAAIDDDPWGQYGPAIRHWEWIVNQSAPGPTVTGKRGGQQLSPVFVEWLMGWPAGWVTEVPGLTRNDKLKVLGNGVVPHQGAAAIRHLLWPVDEAAA
jgi:DNA (cytosine-5)-methyltransferase 1